MLQDITAYKGPVNWYSLYIKYACILSGRGLVCKTDEVGSNPTMRSIVLTKHETTGTIRKTSRDSSINKL